MSRADQILFGSDPTERVVSVEPGSDGVKLYRRIGSGVVVEKRPFRWWILTTQNYELAGAVWTELDGEGFNWLAEFENRDAFESARYWLRDAHAEHIVLQSSAKQFLARSGVTLFKGMSFDEIVRVQLDIETAGLSPENPKSEILLAAISDNRGFETLVEGDERDILRQTVEIIRELDPDVIEGHNIHEFDLPYLAARARMHGIALALGRDGSEVTFGAKQQCAIGYYTRPFVPAHIHGRHVIDTMLLSQRFDVGKGIFTSHSLKALAHTLGISEPDREIIPHDKIASEYKSNPSRVRKYALQDVRETRSLAEIVSPPEFYLTQMVPDTYQHAASTGTGEKINAILIREYLRCGRAVPKQKPPKPLPGGYTEVRTTGVIETIVKCDVESLYPSIMLTNRIKPKSDTLDVFLPALEELTKRRIEAKRKSRETSGRERAYWEGLQSAFKILINSFYGYLAGPFNFNDYEAAAQVTTTGRSIVKRIVEELERTGSQVVEVDTDGVYFKPPPGIEGEQAEINYIQNIGSVLPPGIRLAHDGRYRAMISLKMKNYVLVDYEGQMTFKGSSLRSRADERFGQIFISKAAEYLLQGRKDKVRELYDSFVQKINAGEMTIDLICRRERVTEKTFSAASKKRVAQAVRYSEIGDYVTVYNRNDGTVALASEYNHDEDRDYLLDKLYKFACRLRQAFGDEFDELFPKPSTTMRIEAAGQQKLFD
ncbi:MAG: 3'-5' exonuclease [Armatimonadota bacterium]|nr:3'-5' exonuclease [Armatimonadota bacterium]